MKRSIPLFLACVAAVGCGSDEGPTAIRVDTINIGLAGAFVPNEAARRDPVIDAVANLDSDVVCVQEAWEQADKDALIAAAATNFPHVAVHTTDYNTALTSPEAQDGTIPPAPDMAPCANLMTELEAAITCLSDNCSTMPGSDQGQTTSSDCAAENCVASVSTLLLGSPEHLRCYSCLTTSLPTENFADMSSLCTTETNADIAFRGQSSTMILSKHPLSNIENVVMPGTWNRRVITVATATLPSGAEVDVYCNHLTPLFNSLTFPYTGRYGEGMSGAAGWASEQLLQANKLVALVEERSATRPAVILGDFNTGRANLGDGLSDEAPLTFDRLNEAFTLGVAGDYTGQCTYCADNANDAEDMNNVWIDHIFIRNLEASAVISTERTFDQATVPTDNGMVPPSDHYGLQSTIEVPAP